MEANLNLTGNVASFLTKMKGNPAMVTVIDEWKTEVRREGGFTVLMRQL